MRSPGRRRFVVLLLAIVAVTTFIELFRGSNPQHTPSNNIWASHSLFFGKRFNWKNVPQRYPVESYTLLPSGRPKTIPRIQADFEPETPEERRVREARRNAVKEAFLHSWEGYKRNAWSQDEVSPLSGVAKNAFGGWGATLVDSLDTLWIMGLEHEFAAAVSEVRRIDFSSSSMHELNVFETTIRFLGGLLGAYDVSGHKYRPILQKAVELGDMLYVAFDTPNRMPITRWDWKNAALGGGQEAEMHALLAEVGSLALEFTRLSQLTGDHKWYDAVARVTDVLHEKQNHTRIPGLWPQTLNMRGIDFSRDTSFSMGSMSDSFYEYLPKQYVLLGGQSDQSREMYEHALRSAKDYLFFRPLNPENKRMLLAGSRTGYTGFNGKLVPEGQHLSCFAGGMVAVAAKIFQQPEELETARQLLDGCLWAYESMPSGIMAEIFTAVPCFEGLYDDCTWSQRNWYDAVTSHAKKQISPFETLNEPPQQVIMQNNLAPGMVEISDSSYNLRPEAIESIFVMYRITGDKTLEDKAWNMFQTINNVTRTELAYASVRDVTQKHPTLTDSMESFWFAETLKYFYLIFSEPNVVSLDDYVLNTEAHPLLRQK